MRHFKFIKSQGWAFFLFLFSTSASYAAEFTLTSTDVHDNENIQSKFLANDFGCTGGNIRPTLSWNNVPAGTKSFAVTLYDQDAHTGSGFWHWVVADIPAKTTDLKGNTLPGGAITKANDTGKKSYLGPCPPVGEVHTYTYTLYALDTAKLEAPGDSTAPLTGYFINKHATAKAAINLRVSRTQ
ncbi:YbhB/YbcL family Raf kinase inhibitor-like protein [Sodalis ligni]|nr:YbhB/YbcL family Raf kinase inhibitor-like protein [Sodalis ligni]